MRYLYLGLLIVMAGLLLLFQVQNLSSVTINFLSASLTVPVSILVLVVYVLGMLTGGALVSLVRSWLAHAKKSA